MAPDLAWAVGMDAIVIEEMIHDISLACGASYQYTVKNGQLVSVDLKGRRDESQDLYAFITENVKALNSCSFEVLSSKRDQLTELFFKILPPHDYDHSQISYDGALELVLDPTVAASHHLEDAVDPASQKKIHETLAEAEFAVRLGSAFEKAASRYHQVYYILDRAKRRLGVYKPVVLIDAKDDVYGASEIRDAHLAEVANSAIDEFLGLGVVPHTVLIDFCASNEIGSFQFYVEDAIHLFDCLGSGGDLWDADYTLLQERLNTEPIAALMMINFEEFAFLDLLTANNDRHFKNILYISNEGKLIAIDNGNSFPWAHEKDLPTRKMHPLHWFRWRTLPQAQKPFSERMVEKINAFSIEKIEEIARKHLVDERTASSVEFIEGKIKTLVQRAEEIRRLANQDVKISQIAISLLTLEDSESYTQVPEPISVKSFNGKKKHSRDRRRRFCRVASR